MHSPDLFRPWSAGALGTNSQAPHADDGKALSARRPAPIPVGYRRPQPSPNKMRKTKPVHVAADGTALRIKLRPDADDADEVETSMEVLYEQVCARPQDRDSPSANHMIRHTTPDQTHQPHPNMDKKLSKYENQLWGPWKPKYTKIKTPVTRQEWTKQNHHSFGTGFLPSARPRMSSPSRARNSQAFGSEINMRDTRFGNAGSRTPITQVLRANLKTTHTRVKEASKLNALKKLSSLATRSMQPAVVRYKKLPLGKNTAQTAMDASVKGAEVVGAAMCTDRSPISIGRVDLDGVHSGLENPATIPPKRKYRARTLSHPVSASANLRIVGGGQLELIHNECDDGNAFERSSKERAAISTTYLKPKIPNAFSPQMVVPSMHRQDVVYTFPNWDDSNVNIENVIANRLSKWLDPNGEYSRRKIPSAQTQTKVEIEKEPASVDPAALSEQLGGLALLKEGLG